MKTELELLELAAKAYGYRVAYTEPSFTGAVFQLIFDGEYQVSWNPLTDDGDALRLAVKLRLPFIFSEESVYSIGVEDCDETYGVDPYAATRRAIVRAAAAIGEAMP